MRAARSPIGRSELCLVAAIAIYVAASLAPPLAGLTPGGQVVLATVVAGTILWISEAVPLGVTAIIVLAMLGLRVGTSAFDGFTSDVVFYLIGAATIGAAVETSGLAERAARHLLRGARGSTMRLYVQMMAGLPLLAFMIPSAITRNAILIPTYRDVLTAMKIGTHDRAGRALMLALGVLNPLASSALLTGGITSITAATLIGGLSWLQWFALMAVPYYVLMMLGAVALRVMVGRFEVAAAAEESPQGTPLSGAESRTIVVLVVTSALWLTDSLHHLSPAIPALLAAAALLGPRIGVLSWKDAEKRLAWGLVLTVGSSMSLAQQLVATGAAAWLATELVRPLELAGGAPLLFVALLIVVTSVVHLGITNLAACVAILIPIVTAMAASVGANPVVCALAVTIAIDAIIVYPVQTASNLLAYEAGYFTAADVRRFGVIMLALTMLVVIAVLPYWAALGLALRG